MEESGYNPIIQSTTGDSHGNCYDNNSSSLPTSIIELMKHESVYYSNNQTIIDPCPSTK